MEEDVMEAVSSAAGRMTRLLGGLPWYAGMAAEWSLLCDDSRPCGPTDPPWDSRESMLSELDRLRAALIREVLDRPEDDRARLALSVVSTGSNVPTADQFRELASPGPVELNKEVATSYRNVRGYVEGHTKLGPGSLRTSVVDLCIAPKDPESEKSVFEAVRSRSLEDKRFRDSLGIMLLCGIGTEPHVPRAMDAFRDSSLKEIALFHDRLSEIEGKVGTQCKSLRNIAGMNGMNKKSLAYKKAAEGISSEDPFAEAAWAMNTVHLICGTFGKGEPGNALKFRDLCRENASFGNSSLFDAVAECSVKGLYGKPLDKKLDIFQVLERMEDCRGNTLAVREKLIGGDELPEDRLRDVMVNDILWSGEAAMMLRELRLADGSVQHREVMAERLRTLAAHLPYNRISIMVDEAWERGLAPAPRA